MNFYIAPLQGFTDAAFRHFQHKICGGADACFTPFLRIEKGEPCRRTLRDICSPLNDGLNCIPQIIFRDATEFTLLSGVLKKLGFRHIDMNMGCPFPPQVKHGRGAGFLGNVEEMAKISEIVASDTEVSYSLKLRLGINSTSDWRRVLPQLRSFAVSHMTVHPRCAAQQYSGTLDFNEFECFAQAVGKPIVFNGEIHNPDDIDNIMNRYTWLHGIMVGRAMLSRPTLLSEYRDARFSDSTARKNAFLQIHTALIDHYEQSLCGEQQVLSKIKPMLEYADCLIERKLLKKLGKTNKLADYRKLIAGS